MGGMCIAASRLYKSKRNIILGAGILFVAAGMVAGELLYIHIRGWLAGWLAVQLAGWHVYISMSNGTSACVNAHVHECLPLDKLLML